MKNSVNIKLKCDSNNDKKLSKRMMHTIENDVIKLFPEITIGEIVSYLNMYELKEEKMEIWNWHATWYWQAAVEIAVKKIKAKLGDDYNSLNITVDLSFNKTGKEE